MVLVRFVSQPAAHLLQQVVMLAGSYVHVFARPHLFVSLLGLHASVQKVMLMVKRLIGIGNIH